MSFVEVGESKLESEIWDALQTGVDCRGRVQRTMIHIELIDPSERLNCVLQEMFCVRQ